MSGNQKLIDSEQINTGILSFCQLKSIPIQCLSVYHEIQFCLTLTKSLHLLFLINSHRVLINQSFYPLNYFSAPKSNVYEVISSLVILICLQFLLFRISNQIGNIKGMVTVKQKKSI